MRRFKKTCLPVSLRTPSTAEAVGPDQTASRLQPVSGRIADLLGSAILGGQRAVGSSLPREMHASADLGVSRAAYREAVRTLAAKGLVESRTKSGTHVTQRRRWQVLDPDVLRWAFHSGPNLALINELFELRQILEPHAAELAARRRTAEQLAVMGCALEEMTRHGLTTAAGQAADRRFHEEILVATGNEAMMTLSASVTAAVQWSAMLKCKSNGALRDAIPDHRNVYAAIVERDGPRAAQAARKLIQLSLQDSHALFRAAAEKKLASGAGRTARQA